MGWMVFKQEYIFVICPPCWINIIKSRLNCTTINYLLLNCSMDGIRLGSFLIPAVSGVLLLDSSVADIGIGKNSSLANFSPLSGFFESPSVFHSFRTTCASARPFVLIGFPSFFIESVDDVVSGLLCCGDSMGSVLGESGCEEKDGEFDFCWWLVGNSGDDGEILIALRRTGE